MAGKFAVVTGASSGIGYELAKCCAHDGYDLLIVAEDAKIADAKSSLQTAGVTIESLEADLSTTEGVDAVYQAIGGRKVDALLANAGRGLGRGFLDQDFGEVIQVVETNITGTIYLIHKVAPDMVARGDGRILITGSIAGFMPGSFQAVYNGTKAFIDSFSFALRNEIKDSGVTVTCLMPGATETDFFERADLMDTQVGTSKKQSAAEVAEIGFKAMLNGDGDVVTGWMNKLRAAMANFLPAGVTAQIHRGMAAPGTAKQ